MNLDVESLNRLAIHSKSLRRVPHFSRFCAKWGLSDQLNQAKKGHRRKPNPPCSPCPLWLRFFPAEATETGSHPESYESLSVTSPAGPRQLPPHQPEACHTKAPECSPHPSDGPHHRR